MPQSDHKTLEASARTKMEVAAYPPTMHQGFFNVTKKPFDDVRVRNALLMATDRKYLYENVYFKLGKMATAPWPTLLEWTANPDVNYDKSHPFNPEKAGQMLEEAGYKADASGVRFKVTINYDAAAPDRQQVALAMQAWWKRAGVEVTPQPLETAVLLPKVHRDGNFDFYLAGYSTFGDPAIGIARAFISTTIGNNFGNASRYNNPEVDALFTKATALTTPEERGAIYRQIMTILARDVPSFSTMEGRGYDAASKKLKDAWGYTSIGDWQRAWLDQ